MNPVLFSLRESLHRAGPGHARSCATVALSALRLGVVAGAEPRTYTQGVQFPKGASKTVLSGRLAPDEARNDVVNARDKQFLTVSLVPRLERRRRRGSVIRGQRRPPATAMH